MENSFWQQDWFIWGAVLIIGFPFLTLLLGEIIYRAKSKDKLLTATLRIVRNLIFPSLALFILLNKIIGLSEDTTPLRLVQTGLWLFTIHGSLTVINGLLFDGAKTGTWQANVPKLFRDLSRVFLILCGVAIVLSLVWGADLGGVIAALGVGSIVIGLALQDTLGNLFSGIALLFERPFTEGDWIEVDSVKGKVIEINWRSVHMLTRDLEMLIIPNAALAGATIRNYRRPQKLHVEPIDVGFSYDDPPNKVKRVMKQTALATKGVLEKPEPVIQTISYDDSSIGYRVKLFLSDYDKVPMIRDEFMTRVWYAAERNGLNIPFPIRTLYHNPPTKINSAKVIEEYLQQLHNFPSFASAGGDILAKLAQVATGRAFGEGEKAIAQGDRTEGIYIIVNGQALVTIRAENFVREQEVARLVSGDFFGESALSGKDISPVTVTALSDLEVLILPIETLQIALEQNTRLRQEIGMVMETRRKAIAMTQKTKNRTLNNRNGKSDK
ncbi:mechanosensitive ion channel [Waterburya agarophytonicola K14]|uniref:Mechanosensitive ion channel n=2 Tax=Waterburya TaxID=2886915 RepID=A0A964FDY1_9CYAN|nr:mechanosensitive ion channel [Waterburya agarophytonicola KI4]